MPLVCSETVTQQIIYWQAYYKNYYIFLKF